MRCLYCENNNVHVETLDTGPEVVCYACARRTFLAPVAPSTLDGFFEAAVAAGVASGYENDKVYQRHDYGVYDATDEFTRLARLMGITK